MTNKGHLSSCNIQTLLIVSCRDLHISACPIHHKNETRNIPITNGSRVATRDRADKTRTHYVSRVNAAQHAAPGGRRFHGNSQRADGEPSACWCSTNDDG